MDLKQKKCTPCSKGDTPLKGEKLQKLLEQLQNWEVIDEHHLIKKYTFPDFKKALVFTNRIGEIAENEGHHPTIKLSWGKVVIQLYTHKIDGLSENDFILAAKCDVASLTEI